MKVQKLREMSEEEARQSALDTRRELFNLKVKKGAGDSSEQPLRVKTLRRDLARALTVAGEKARAKT